MPSVLVQLVCFCLVPKSIFLEKSAGLGWLLLYRTSQWIQLYSLSQQDRTRQEERDREKSVASLAFKHTSA